YPSGTDPDSVFGKDNLDFWAHDETYRAAHHGNLGDSTDVFDGARYTAFGPETNPASTSNAGYPTGISVRNIHFEGTTAVMDVHPRPAMVVTDRLDFQDENKDGIIEAGEHVTVRIILRNTGPRVLGGVQCRLSTDDPYVAIDDSVADFGQLLVGSAVGWRMVSFKVTEGFQGQHTAAFDLEIRDEDGNVWMETAEAALLSPQIPLMGLAVLDGGTDSMRGFGNGDGIANPGETIQLQPISELPEDVSSFRMVFETEDAWVRQLGTSFLIASDIPPGHRVLFETEIMGHFAVHRDTFYVETTGEDETPPQVFRALVRPWVVEVGAAATIEVPKAFVVEGGPIARMEARIYAAMTDSGWVDTVALEDDEEAFYATWSYQGISRFVVRIYAEDGAGNGMESRPLEYLISCSPDPPTEPSSWISMGAERVLTHPRVTTLLSDAHGDVWAGTFYEVTRFRGLEWTSWGKDELLGDGVFGLRLDGVGNVWMGMSDSVSRFSASGWTTWRGEGQDFSGKQPIEVFQDASGNMVAQLENGVLMRFQNGGWKQWTTLQALAHSPARVSDIDPFGNLWIGTMPFSASGTDAAVARFDGTHWTTWSSNEGLVGEYVEALVSDALGRVWIGLWPSGARVGGGVGCFDGSEWRFWTEKDGLISSWVYALLMDAEGKLWVGSRGGVSQYDGTVWRNWEMGRICVLVEDPYGRIWAGGNNGLNSFDGSDWKRWTTEHGLVSNNVLLLLADASGRLWVGTDKGLSMYSARTTGIAVPDQETALPRSLVLSPNYPNPFNSTTMIRFEVPATEKVRLILYNVLGQQVRTLVDAKHTAGTYAVRWDGKDDAGREVGSGLYMARIEAGGSVRVRKLMLLR
ncbi:MAG: two-component regulator propeller domain-containing protein, partial [Candidatus Latescibacterota bacterium]